MRPSSILSDFIRDLAKIFFWLWQRCCAHHTFSCPPSHQVPATIAVIHHFTDSCHHHPPTAAATIAFVDHRPASPPLLPVGHLRCRPPPPSLLTTTVMSLQPLPIRKMDITADTGLGVSDIYESRDPDKKSHGSQAERFWPTMVQRRWCMGTDTNRQEQVWKTHPSFYPGTINVQNTSSSMIY